MKNFITLTLVAFLLSACAKTEYVAHVAKQIPLPQDPPPKSIGYFKVGSSYKIKGKRYYPKESYTLTETGTASWYGPGFHGKQTANGEIFDENELTAAHRTLQLPSIVKVTNLDNGRSVILRVNDRGPFAHERILDVSDRGATVLGFKNKGVAKIKLEVLTNESREVAAVAKSGKSTKGFEIAYNQGESPLNDVEIAPKPLQKPGTVTQVALNEADTIQQVSLNPYRDTTVSEHTESSAQIPSVHAEPLNAVIANAAQTDSSLGYAQNAGRVFVQAASFSQESNALNYSKKLAGIGPSHVYLTRINDAPYYRVRLGPYDNSTQAQEILASLQQNGNQNAVIITE